MAKRDMTEAQAQALDDADAQLRTLAYDLQAKLRAAGFNDGDFEAGTDCSRCECTTFLPGYAAFCRTPGCGHSSGFHNFPI